MRKGRKTLMCPSVGQPMEADHNTHYNPWSYDVSLEQEKKGEDLYHYN